MTRKASDPLAILRRRIRQAGQQYRHNNDNSESLFHPVNGFVYAYDIGTVEAALNAYEATLPTEYNEGGEGLSPKEHILREAEMISTVHPSKDARTFAQDVKEYFEALEADHPPPSLELVRQGSWEPTPES